MIFTFLGRPRIYRPSTGRGYVLPRVSNQVESGFQLGLDAKGRVWTVQRGSDGRKGYWSGGIAHRFARLRVPRGVRDIGEREGQLFGGQVPLWVSRDSGRHWRAIRDR